MSIVEALGGLVSVAGVVELASTLELDGVGGADVSGTFSPAVGPVAMLVTGHIIVYSDTSSVVTWPLGQSVTSGAHEVTV